MNALIVTGMLALVGFGGYAVADCNDLAGQGYLCAEVNENGVDAELYLEPQPPIDAAAVECLDLAGQGYACAELSDSGVDFEIYLEPQPPRNAAECVGEDGISLCAGEGGASWEVDREDLGIYSEGGISLS